MKNPCIDCNACCEHEREGECQGGYERYLACLRSYVGCAECSAKDKKIADLETDAKGYAIQHKDFLGRAKLAECKLATIVGACSATVGDCPDGPGYPEGVCEDCRFRRICGALDKVSA